MPDRDLIALAGEAFPTSAPYDHLRRKAVLELAKALRCGELAMKELAANACETIWRDLLDFSSGGICVVLASLHYDEADYVRDYEEFVALKGSEAPATFLLILSISRIRVATNLRLPGRPSIHPAICLLRRSPARSPLHSIIWLSTSLSWSRAAWTTA